MVVVVNTMQVTHIQGLQSTAQRRGFEEAPVEPEAHGEIGADRRAGGIQHHCNCKLCISSLGSRRAVSARRRRTQGCELKYHNRWYSADASYKDP